MTYHVPVMVAEVVEGLITDPAGTYLDATVGGGGHSRAILQALGSSGRLIAVDRDRDAVQTASKSLEFFADRVVVLQGSFVELRALLEEQQLLQGLNGALFDLGISSHQIDEPGRGFSYREDGPLDMRMEPDSGISAAEWIDRASEAELARIIKEYGEERQARRIARTICRLRLQQPLETTADLRRAVASTRPQRLTKTLARVFQAFRIVVNDELGQLDKGLDAVIEWLLPGGRLAVIAYHSLEDRLVKSKLADLVRGCVCPPKIPVCVCGRKPQFKKVQRKPLRAVEEEVRDNRRARSAILRIYEKL